MPHTTSSEMQIGTNQLYHLGPFACSRERTKPDMKDVPYRVLLESLSWTQARAGAFLGVSRRSLPARPAEDRPRDRTQGAKAAREGCGYFEGGQVARHRDWHGPAHLRRASDESARGGAMSKGEQPQALGQSLQKSFATRWTPR
jgi:hypothetical protein